MARVCTRCKELKEEHEFHGSYKVPRKDGTFHIKKRSHCKDCTNELHKYWEARANSEGFVLGGVKRSKRKLWELYKLTPEDYITMFTNQDGLCAVCREEPPSVVDHDHATNKVRALLCPHCNIMLGNALDNVTRLARGIEYLNNNRDDG